MRYLILVVSIWKVSLVILIGAAVVIILSIALVIVTSIALKRGLYRIQTNCRSLLQRWSRVALFQQHRILVLLVETLVIGQIEETIMIN